MCLFHLEKMFGTSWFDIYIYTFSRLIVYLRDSFFFLRSWCLTYSISLWLLITWLLSGWCDYSYASLPPLFIWITVTCHLTSLAETIAAVTIHSHIHPCVIQNVSSLFRIVAFVHSAVTRTNSLTYTHYILYIALQIINYVTSFLDDLRHTIYEWTSYIMCVQWVASFILLPQLRPARIVFGNRVAVCVCEKIVWSNNKIAPSSMLVGRGPYCIQLL